MSALTAGWIAQASGGELLRGDPGEPASAVSIDTRTLSRGEAYIAIPGDRFDGHDFVTDAVERGASIVIVQHRAAAESVDVPVVLVDHARTALLALGAARRRALEDLLVVGVTGSAGKTTTVRLIDAALRSTLKTRASRKSFNNEIGLALTLLSARESDDVLICEIGMNAPGEIAPLARAAALDVAVVTNVGRAHLGAFDSIDDIAREKAAIFEGLSAEGWTVASADSPALAPHLAGRARLLTFGAALGADFRVTGAAHETRDDAPGLGFAVNDEHCWIPLLGAHNASNAAAALAVASILTVPAQRAVAGLAQTEAPPMRMQLERIAGALVLNDAYNANPESVGAALDALTDLGAAARRRIVILGDMLELGAHSVSAHRELGDRLANTDSLDLVIAAGPLAALAAARLRELGWPEDRAVTVESLDDGGADRIAGEIREGDAALIKGSRGSRLERVVDALRAHAG